VLQSAVELAVGLHTKEVIAFIFAFEALRHANYIGKHKGKLRNL
jgi:hypothetical protein